MMTGKILFCRGDGKSLARPGRKQANVSVRTAWISFGALSCRKKNLMTARVSMLLKSRASLTCFRACFLPGRAKDLSALRVRKSYFVQQIPIPPLSTFYALNMNLCVRLNSEEHFEWGGNNSLFGRMFMNLLSPKTASVVCWPLVPEFAGLNPAEVVGFFRASEKSSACLPSEGKWKNLSHVPALPACKRT